MDLSKVDVYDFLRALGIRNIHPDDPKQMSLVDEIQFSCPFPGHNFGDESPSAYMNVESTAFFCHGCKSKGNAIHFLAKLEGISPLLAARHIRERYGSEFLETDSFSYELENQLFDSNKLQDNSEHLTDESSCHLEELLGVQFPEPCLDYLHKRGFCDGAIRAWQIGYDPISDRIAIPVRNENGVLIGFKGRSYRPEHKPKYLVLGDRPKRPKGYGFPTYDVSRVVFGLDKFIPHAHEFNHKLIIVEGELNVIALWQYGIKNVVSLNGSHASSHLIDLVLSQANEVIIFFDSDNAGRKGRDKAALALSPYIPVKLVEDHDGDPASLTAEQCSKLISKARAIDLLGITQD